MTDHFIELQGIGKSLGGRTVLDDLSLDVRRGERLALLGASGSGKSVLLRHIVGLMRADRGRVRIDGKDLTDLSERELVPIRRRVAFIFQGGALFDSMSVYENCAFALLEQRKLKPAEIRDRVGTALALVGLEGIEATMPSELSGGMKKRVALARSMALDPECILYDEPTSGLDPVTGARVSELIRDTAQRAKVTSVVVTHDIPSAYLFADRLAFLHLGRIAFIGTVEEARESPVPELQEFLGAYRERP